MTTHVLVLNGPNLNRLGKRQPDIYGATSLTEVEEALVAYGKTLGATVTCRQSNSEAQLLDWIHDAADAKQPVIINPGGLTHTSVVLCDALAEVADHAGYIEVHISNIHAREEFRHHSYISAKARGTIAGLGIKGYFLALDALVGDNPLTS
ncbi:MAG: type II 3-dehydroquinate dehydratase [Corynebacterium sp.]|nr:type II 3-dehydroquinate dehydratase [Corynebacterium sp.]